MIPEKQEWAAMDTAMKDGRIVWLVYKSEFRDNVRYVVVAARYDSWIGNWRNHPAGDLHIYEPICWAPYVIPTAPRADLCRDFERMNREHS